MGDIYAGGNNFSCSDIDFENNIWKNFICRLDTFIAYREGTYFIRGYPFYNLTTLRTTTS